jgi:hypothetical protein
MNAHIPPNVIWAHIFEDVRLTPSAQDHILKCEECLETVLLCLKSESFVAVVEALEGF